MLSLISVQYIWPACSFVFMMHVWTSSHLYSCHCILHASRCALACMQVKSLDITFSKTSCACAMCNLYAAACVHMFTHPTHANACTIEAQPVSHLLWVVIPVLVSQLCKVLCSAAASALTCPCHDVTDLTDLDHLPYGEECTCMHSPLSCTRDTKYGKVLWCACNDTPQRLDISWSSLPTLDYLEDFAVSGMLGTACRWQLTTPASAFEP